MIMYLYHNVQYIILRPRSIAIQGNYALSPHFSLSMLDIVNATLTEVLSIALCMGHYIWPHR